MMLPTNALSEAGHTKGVIYWSVRNEGLLDNAIPDNDSRAKLLSAMKES